VLVGNIIKWETKMISSNLYWHGLYKQSYDIWHSDAYAHPAKMSPALCFRIIQHLEEHGILNKDSTILDPMGGIGTTALCACLKGYKAITVELEQKFIDLQIKNKDYFITRKGIKLDWSILQGDARDLVNLLSQKGLVTITSPPYAEAQTGGGIAKEGYLDKHIDKQGKNQPRKIGHSCGYMAEAQGKTEGQIANFPDVVTITSPPYANPRSTSEEYDDKYDLRRPENYKWSRESFGGRYGNTNWQIGQLKDGTYLSEMAKIYSQLSQVSDILVIVLKDPTKNGKIRELGKDTVYVLENNCGWKMFDYKRAVLFEEQESKTLFGDTAKKIKGRISFFKLLAHRKGSPVSNFEHVIFCGKEDFVKEKEDKK